MLTLEVKRDGEVIAVAHVTRRAGQYEAVFNTVEGEVFTSQVQMEECDTWSMLKALLTDMEGV